MVAKKMSISLQPCEQSGSPDREHGQPRVFQGQTRGEMVKKMEKEQMWSRMGTALPTSRLVEQTPQACSEPQKGRFWQHIGRTPFVYPVNGPDQLVRQMLHLCDRNKHLGKGPGTFNEDCDVTQCGRLGVGRCGFGSGAGCLGCHVVYI